jgi:hypothetical protein
VKLLFKHYWLEMSMAAVKATKSGYNLGHKVNKFPTVIKGKKTK